MADTTTEKPTVESVEEKKTVEKPEVEADADSNGTTKEVKEGNGHSDAAPEEGNGHTEEKNGHTEEDKPADEKTLKRKEVPADDAEAPKKKKLIEPEEKEVNEAAAAEA